MRCANTSSTTILVGLHRVGIVGLRNALQRADESGLEDRDTLVDLLIESLAADNYFPDPRLVSFRTAIWREYLRHRGEDFRPFYSEIEVTVRGDAGEERDRFVETLRSVLGDFELAPVIELAPARRTESGLQLVIHDEVIVQGLQSRERFKAAVRNSISDW